MKPVHALVAGSLLGSVWLASCSDGSSKKVHGSGGASGEAGAAGETSPAAGTGGKPAGGSGGTAGTGGAAGGEAAAGEPGAGGAGGASPGGQGGESGGGPVLACFDDSAAGAPGFGEAGAGNQQHVVYDCKAIVAALAPTFDPVGNTVTLDASRLGPVASGEFTFYYYFNDGQGGEDCADSTVNVSGNQLVLPVGTTHSVNQFYIPVLNLHDQCGNTATLPPPDDAGDCFNLTFHSDTSGDAGTTWQVDCFEGGCDPKCSARLPP